MLHKPTFKPNLKHFSAWIVRVYKKRSFKWLLVPGIVTGAVVVSGTATLAMNSQLRTDFFQTISLQQPVKKSSSQAQTKSTITATANKPTKTSSPNPAPAALPTTQSNQPTRIKYKTSPDPFSDAWSYTPPGPTPGDINIAVSAPGQVKPGTKIVYSAVKEDTVYYGGDMVFSNPTVVIHKSQSTTSSWLTVTTPDGAAMIAPHEPWYDTNPSAYVNFNGDPNGTAVSWQIEFMVNSNLPNGTYQAHITAWRSGGTGTLEWEYDGFATIDVES